MRTARLIAPLLALVSAAGAAHALTLGPREPLTEDALERLVDEALLADAHGRLAIEIDQPRLPLANQSEATTRIRLNGLQRDPRSGRFHATLSGTTDVGRSFALAVRGRAVELLEIPVLNRRIEQRELIAEADLDWLEVPADRLPRGAILDPDQVVGGEARRHLAARRILMARDVGEPLLVRRNQPVRLLYTAGSLTISALGTAQEDGAAGALVRVINPDSRRQLQGLVTGPDEVTVSTAQLSAE